MKITEPYSPMARAKASATPLSQAGKISGKIDTPKGRPPAGAKAMRRLLKFVVPCLQNRLYGANDERQPDEDQDHHNAGIGIAVGKIEPGKRIGRKEHSGGRTHACQAN